MKSSVMKKLLMTITVAVAVMVLFSLTAFAEDYGNFSYTPVTPEVEGEFEPYIIIDRYNAGDDATETVVVVPSEIEDVPVTQIAASAFDGKNTLTEVIIPDSVEVISNAAFINCTALKVAVIPDSVKVIGDSAFQGCSALEYVVIGDGVKSIGSLAFKNCTALSKLDLGNSVEVINNGAFYGCEALAKVYIPASVKTIGSYAFGFVQHEGHECAVEGFEFFTDANTAVDAYAAAYVPVADDMTAEAVAFAVTKGIKACDDAAHTLEMVNVRVATDSYEGVDMAQCSKCLAIATQPNTEIAPKETSISQYISLIVIALAVIAVVAYGVIYVKKAKAHREKAIAEYKAGKELTDVAEKNAYEAKLEAKYQKKRAKQEKRLEMFKDK